jgi:4-amino-4-deoxychorismate lyase
MLEFIESICCRQGEFQLLSLHQQRVNKTFAMYAPDITPIALDEIQIPRQFKKAEIVKCRITYQENIKKIEFQLYERKQPRRFFYVNDDNINYSYKYSNRTELEEIAARVDVSEEVVILKHNMVTDASYSNIALWNGSEWHTPKYPLLKGVQREHLLNAGQLIEKVILSGDVERYQKISFINALNGLGERELEI